MNFYICSTPYHLFISLCHISVIQEEGILYLTTHDENSEKIFRSIYDKLQAFPLVHSVSIRKRDRMKEKLKLESLKDLMEYPKYKDVLEKGCLYNFAWNPYSTYTTSNYLFKKSNKAVFIEEGSILYACPKPSDTSQFIKKILYGISTDFYNSDKLEEILVHYPERYPEYLKKKLKKFNVVDMFTNLDDDQKKDIINVFLNKEQLEKLLQSDFQNTVIILTQPLSEDGFITEGEKIKLYKEIVEQNKEYTILIKKHPRERTSYQFENVVEIEGFFPSEIFTMLEIRFKKAIGICTSAVTSMDAEEKINTNENFLKRRANNG